jgi:hypothetical protein
MNTQILKTKEANKTPQPITLIRDLDKYFLPSPLMRKPINGNRGIK